MSAQQTTSFLTELFSKRGSISPGWNPIQFLELWGGKIIEPTAFEPDPSTCRESVYYNAITNTLYKKVVTRHQNGAITAYWQKISD